jgi:hypothetical protein
MSTPSGKYGPSPWVISPSAFFGKLCVAGQTHHSYERFAQQALPNRLPLLQKIFSAWVLYLVCERALPGGYAAEAANFEALTRDVAYT